MDEVVCGVLGEQRAEGGGAERETISGESQSTAPVSRAVRCGRSAERERMAVVHPDAATDTRIDAGMELRRGPQLRVRGHWGRPADRYDGTFFVLLSLSLRG